MRMKMYVEIINNKMYISMINLKKLKKLCALSRVHLLHETLKGKTVYYVDISQINLFISVMNNSHIDVVFLGKEL